MHFGAFPVIVGMMDPLSDNWPAQIVGAFALMASIYTFQARSRSEILRRQMGCSVLYCVHFLLLGAVMGAAMAVIVGLRDLVFFERHKKAWADHALWLFFFMGLMVAALAIDFEGYLSLLPVIGTILATYAFWQDSPAKIRLYVSGAASLWIPYAIAVDSYASLISHLIIVVSVNAAMARLDRHGKPKKGRPNPVFRPHIEHPYFKRT